MKANLLDAALFEGDASKPQLPRGIGDKLEAAAAMMSHLVPTAPLDRPSNGVRWVMLANAAGLPPDEMMSLLLWIEEAYGTEMAERAGKPLPQIPVPPPHTAASPSPASGGAGLLGGMPLLGGPGTGLMPFTPTQAPQAPAYQFTAQAAPLPPVPAPPPSYVPPPSSLVSTSMAANLALDVQEQRLTEGELIYSTFTLHTAQTPPGAHSELRYGYDPRATKPYRNVSTPSGSVTLAKLCEEAGTAVADFNQHFLAAASCLRMCGMTVAADRLTTMWMEVQTQIQSPDMLRAYFREYLRKYAGRFLPVLMDEKLVLRCVTMSRDSPSNETASQFAALTAKLTTMEAAITKLTTSTIDLAAKASAASSAVGSLKTEVADLKSRLVKAEKSHCGYCGREGHVMKDCLTHKADKEKVKP